MDLLRISFELDNKFVEEFILQWLVEKSTSVAVWRELLMYPVSRVMEEVEGGGVAKGV